ncbi:LysR family transcriptional regulator [Paraburkholderia fungorum]|uniref:LysR family transcriptional regulator n=1 Tax=Paraburkholderia fungorum TaxID=134537 RepID=UPI0038BBF0BF
MLTLKQLEAVYWVAKLGTFGAAADRLYTTQSAISKRISELEVFFEVSLFDRSRRIVQLTAKGRELLEAAEEMLQARDRLLDRMGKEVEVVRHFRLGITELIALTFLPRLVQEIRETYPTVSLEPEIDVTTNLAARLLRGEVDFIIAPAVLKDPRFTSVPLKKLQLHWMASPSLIADSRVLSLEEIAGYPILMQIGTSGVDAIYERWFASKNLAIRRTFAGNSLIALSSLTVAGFGVSYLPALYFSDLADQGLLNVLHSTQRLPAVRYYAIYRNDGPTPLYSMVADLAQRLCDFSKPDLASVISQ